MSEPLKSSDHRLAAVVGKYNRSSEQFDQLLAEMDAFFNKEPKPHASLGEFDAEKGEWIEHFQILEEPPVRFGVILGDVIHNLRSALDHLIWQVTLLDGGTPDRNTQFPIIAEGQHEFDTEAKRRIPDLSPEHRAVVQKVQPYHAGDEARRHPLAVLGCFSNIDKHRLVHPTNSASIASIANAKAALDRLVESFQGDNPSPVESFWLIKDGQRLEHGTPWFRIKFRPGEEPPREVNMSGHIPLGIAFGEIGLASEEIKRIAELVWAIIETFMRGFPETTFEDE